jgi:hypothetical protein
MEFARAAGEVGGHVILHEYRDEVVDRVFLDVVGLGMGAELDPVIFEVALFVAVAGFAGRIEAGGDGRLAVRDKLPGVRLGSVDFGGQAVGGQSEQNSDPGGMTGRDNGRQANFGRGPCGEEGGDSARDGVEGIELFFEAQGAVVQGEEGGPVALFGGGADPQAWRAAWASRANATMRSGNGW